MKYEIKDQTLHITLPEKITIDGIDDFDRALQEIPIPETCSRIIMDAEKLRYISSAGLRSLLRFRENCKLPISITQVNIDVYEIFEDTGFTRIFDIRLKLRYISTEGLREQGRGMYGAVYKVDDETVMKVFYELASEEGLNRILASIRTAFVNGIPTILPFYTVRTDRGYGMVFELVNSECLADLIHEHPTDAEEYAEKMASLAAVLANTEFSPGTIQDRKEMLKSEMASAAGLLEEDELLELVSYIDAVPSANTAVHGDFHARNIYISDGRLLLIDMDDFCLGHPVWDIACLYRVYPYMYSLGEEEVEELFELNGAIAYEDFYKNVMHLNFDETSKLWESFIRHYFEGRTKEEVSSFMVAAKLYSDFMVVRFCLDQCRKMTDDQVRLDRKRKLIRKILLRMRQYDLAAVTRIMEGWKWGG